MCMHAKPEADHATTNMTLIKSDTISRGGTGAETGCKAACRSKNNHQLIEDDIKIKSTGLT